MKKQPQITEKTKKNLMTSFWDLYKNKDLSKIPLVTFAIKLNMKELLFIDISTIYLIFLHN